MSEAESFVIGWDLGGGADGRNKGSLSIIRVQGTGETVTADVILHEVGTHGAISLREIMDKFENAKKGGVKNGGVLP